MKTMLLVVPLVVCMSMMSNACFIADKVQVQITNQLENAEDLTLHCKSADDDLGQHVLHKVGSYKFSFCPPNFIFVVKLL